MDLAAQLLWFHVSHPPAAAKHLGVVSLNPDQPWLRDFPAAGIETADPLLVENGTATLTGMDAAIWRCHSDGSLQPIARLDDTLLATGLPGIGARPGRFDITRLASHLTQRPDGRIVIDPIIGGTSMLAEIDPLSGTTTLLQRFDRAHGHSHWDHAQASPLDADLTLIAQDWDRDPITGAVTPLS